MATAREALHELAEALPEAAAEELAAIGQELLQHWPIEGVREVEDADELAIVLDALNDDGTEPELTVDEAKAYLAELRRRRRA